MPHVIHVHSDRHSSVPSTHLAARRASERHELHRAVDGDWPPVPDDPAELRGVLAAGLAAVATLPLVTLLLEAWPHASRGLMAAIAALPLASLLLVAVTWRPTGGGRP